MGCLSWPRFRVLGMVLFLGAGFAPAQEKPASPAPEAPSPSVVVEERIATWTKALESLKATAPPDAKSLQERAAVLESSIEAGERHLQAIELRRSAETRLKAVEKADAEWKGPSGKAPYSVTEADRYRSTYLAADRALGVGVNFRQVVDQTLDTIQEKLVQTEAAVRRAQDTLARATRDEEKAAAKDVLELEQARLRMFAEEKEAVAVQAESVELNVRTETLKRDLAARQLKSLGDGLVFAKEDLERILANITRSRTALVEERQRSLRSSRSSLNRRVAEAGAPSQGDVLNWRIAMADVRAELWKARHSFINATEATDRLREQKVLEEYLERPAMWRTLVESRQSTVRAAIFDLEGKPKETTTAGETELLAEYRAIDSLLQKAVEEAKDLENLPAIWGLREDVARSKKGFTAWFTAARVWTTDTAIALWNLELYTVRETVMVDGRSVTGDRAITLGKVLILLGIVSAGYLLLRTFATRVARRVQSRFHLEPGKDLTIRRWILSAGMVALALYAMHYARIPLTAFAFLGGALAIGVGFGTQNLIKNFISGLLIHAEKPLRVGDVLEVGQVNGTVVEIGMRSSVIRHWDGIETLIPNSAFLENNVTNWTYSDRRLRHSVKVGVAYGSETRKVVQLLEQAATTHGKVLSSPEPFVLFEDFADSALVFSLYFWIDMTQSGRAQVASDLRFMIEKAFAENGISMAFPQRDMHLTSDAPLSIRVVRDAGNAGGVNEGDKELPHSVVAEHGQAEG